MTNPKFIGATWCGWTQRQLHVLDDLNITQNDVSMCMSDQKHTLHNGTEIPKCTEQELAGVSGYPHWIIDGEVKPGYKSEEVVANFVNKKDSIDTVKYAVPFEDDNDPKVEKKEQKNELDNWDQIKKKAEDSIHGCDIISNQYEKVASEIKILDNLL